MIGLQVKAETLKAWLMKVNEIWRADTEMWHQEPKDEDVRKTEKSSQE